MADALKPLIGIAVERSLSRDEAVTAFNIIMSGEATPSQVAGFLMALRMRGETVEEITAAASVMRSKALTVTAPKGAMDIVGTGGDGKKTLNISTATALVVAGAGVPVAKHGNRALSSKSGASDALTALGVNLDASVSAIEQSLKETNIGYMAAPNHHSAMRHVMPIRQEMGVRTIFNILGPLTNPAAVTRQLTGAFSTDWLRPMAETLRALGTVKAWLVHGGDGTDELSIAAPSKVCALENDKVIEFTVSPEDAGLPTHPFESIIGGEPADNAKKLSALLDGEKNGYRDAVLLNVAGALIVADKVSDLREGTALAATSIDSGAARNALEKLKRITNTV